MKLVLHVQHIVDAIKFIVKITIGDFEQFVFSRTVCTTHICFSMSGRTCGKCRLHGQVELLKGHKRNCPYANCSCPKCASHEHLLALRMTDRHSNEDKGKRWHTNLTQSCTAKKAEDHQAVRFPEMTA